MTISSNSRRSLLCQKIFGEISEKGCPNHTEWPVDSWDQPEITRRSKHPLTLDKRCWPAASLFIIWYHTLTRKSTVWSHFANYLFICHEWRLGCWLKTSEKCGTPKYPNLKLPDVGGHLRICKLGEGFAGVDQGSYFAEHQKSKSLSQLFPSFWIHQTGDHSSGEVASISLPRRD